MRGKSGKNLQELQKQDEREAEANSTFEMAAPS